MANEFVNVKEIARHALPRLMENLVFPNLVYRDYSEEYQSGKGATIQVRKPVVLQAAEFDAQTGTEPGSVQENVTEVTLDKLATVDVEFGAVESATSMDDLTRLFIAPAAAALAEKINRDGLALYAQVSNVTGTGHTPDSLAAFADAARVLNENKAPVTGRSGVWDPAANAMFQQIPALVNAEKSGTTEALRAGAIGRVFGLDNYMAQSVAEHTCGNANTMTLSLGQAAEKGKTEVRVKANAVCNLKAGDVLVIGGRGYAVKKDAGLTTGAVTVELVSPLEEDVAATATVTVSGGGKQNLVFHQNAFAFVTRPLCAPAGVESYTTHFNGISLRVCRGYDMKYKKDMLSMDVLYGYKAIYPELAVRVMG